ncbi:MAG: ABC transporter ATP-binding protein [Firmicutes bacterium]|nr:ABC transporter ATP-binding protein [Bacillota bacterium]
MNAANLLEIHGLHLYFDTYLGTVRAVEGLDLTVSRGETVGLVGESGCGKSVSALAILGLISQPPGRIAGGKILFKGEDLLKKSPAELRNIRGKYISMIFQEPMSSLNPVYRVGDQMVEVIMLHRRVSRGEARKIALEMLHEVQMPDPEAVMQKYPFEMSGGMLQRVMIAMELSGKPDLLLADEPTTALDVTVQAQILRLMKNLVKKMNASVLLITHDLGVVAQTCDRVAVMYAGQVVEVAPTEELFTDPRHPYTRGLMGCFPDPNRQDAELAAIEGTVPDLINPPGGCRFHPRCPRAGDICGKEGPGPVAISDDHVVHCFFARQASDDHSEGGTGKGVAVLG